MTVQGPVKKQQPDGMSHRGATKGTGQDVKKQKWGGGGGHWVHWPAKGVGRTQSHLLLQCSLALVVAMMYVKTHGVSE